MVGHRARERPKQTGEMEAATYLGSSRRTSVPRTLAPPSSSQVTIVRECNDFRNVVGRFAILSGWRLHRIEGAWERARGGKKRIPLPRHTDPLVTGSWAELEFPCRKVAFGAFSSPMGGIDRSSSWCRPVSGSHSSPLRSVRRPASLSWSLYSVLKASALVSLFSLYEGP